jgi:transcriptional regulator with XRE-family HTH domain
MESEMEQAFDKTEKSEKAGAPSVAIDGARIKSVREAKKLTQLYVASVVGVTTDTISRWENNRYPSIKRDNAEKLASALEVELGDILRRDEVQEVPETAPSPPSGRGLRFLLSGLAALALLMLAIFFLNRHLAQAPTAVRWAPHFAAPGEVMPVQIKLTRQGGGNTGFILKEKLPDGWQLVSAVPPSSAAEASGSAIKWLIPGGTAPVTVSYTVRLPASPALRSEARLQGEIVLHSSGMNRTEPVAGSSNVRIGPYHWADTNGDGRIDDDEIMPAYYICEEMKGLDLDWKIIEAIWSGKGYHWDAKSGFTVLK